MESKNYNDYLIEMQDLLNSSENNTFNLMVNLAYTGEFKNVKKPEKNNSENLKFLKFEDAKDINLNILASLLKEIYAAQELFNQNNEL